MTTRHAATTILPEEIAKFAAMADEWWDPEGKFRPLHTFNPERIRYVRDRAGAHFKRAVTATRPFAGLRLLDVGCGGGLISEPMARLGFTVTGIDAGDKNIGVAAHHATKMGLNIDYRCAPPEALAAEGHAYDVVLALEVVEHVADVDSFLAATAGLLAPGGLMIAATINRTLKSLAMAKVGAEYILRWLPPGTHDWRKFVKPSELASSLRGGGLTIADMTGMTYDVFKDVWALGRDVDVNYMMAATKPA